MSEILVNKTLETITPEILAELFWEMSSDEQARFYNRLSEVSDFKFPFQLQSITEENGLTLAGRRVMQSIGDYSHWGLVCTIINGKKP